MTQNRLWNFEFTTKKDFPLNLLSPMPKDSLKWEARFFWSDEEPITLNLIDSSMADLQHYENKHKMDYYYLLPECNYNIKRRGERILYKPIVEQSKLALGFGKKINLADKSEYAKAPHLEELCNQAQTTALIVPVKKESYTFRFPTSPTIKLELAQLEVHNKIYYSACIEGRSHPLVETLYTHLLGLEKASDYVSFLNRILRL